LKSKISNIRIRCLPIFRKKKKEKKNPAFDKKVELANMHTVENNEKYNAVTQKHLEYYEENVKDLGEKGVEPDQAHNVITNSKSKRQKRNARRILKKR